MVPREYSLHLSACCLAAANDSQGADVERITGQLEALGSNQWQGHLIERVCLPLSAWLSNEPWTLTLIGDALTSKKRSTCCPRHK